MIDDGIDKPINIQKVALTTSWGTCYGIECLIFSLPKHHSLLVLVTGNPESPEHVIIVVAVHLLVELMKIFACNDYLKFAPCPLKRDLVNLPAWHSHIFGDIISSGCWLRWRSGSVAATSLLTPSASKTLRGNVENESLKRIPEAGSLVPFVSIFI